MFERLISDNKLSTSLILLVGVLVSTFGASQNLRAVNQETVLATRSDKVALQWIDTHTPENARFFINTIGWSANNYRGLDGGGWILPSTGRWSIVPTVFYPMSGDKDFVENTVDQGKRASLISACGEDFWSLIYDAQISYLYIKEGVGGLQPSTLTDCEGIRQLTQIEDIHIYLVNNPVITP